MNPDKYMYMRILLVAALIGNQAFAKTRTFETPEMVDGAIDTAGEALDKVGQLKDTAKENLLKFLADERDSIGNRFSELMPAEMRVRNEIVQKKLIVYALERGKAAQKVGTFNDEQMVYVDVGALFLEGGFFLAARGVTKFAKRVFKGKLIPGTSAALLGGAGSLIATLYLASGVVALNMGSARAQETIDRLNGEIADLSMTLKTLETKPVEMPQAPPEPNGAGISQGEDHAVVAESGAKR